MWNPIQKWFGANRGDIPLEATKPDEFKWYEPGPENPFGIRFLDVRPLTWHVTAGTQDPRIATSFCELRNSEGRELVNAAIDNATTIACDLSLPHNGDALEGIVFKADEMETKWDIYIYDSVFYFARSCTGQLQYRAFADVGPQAIRIHQIEAAAENADTATQTVYFLMATHAMRRVFPHTIPKDMPEEPQIIAYFSFSQFGKLACYATYEDITRLEIAPPKAQSE